jgi:serine/threonine protein kinase
MNTIEFKLETHHQIALALGMEPQAVQNFAKLVIPVELTRKNIKNTLSTLSQDLDNVGLEGRFIISSGRAKMMLVRVGIWEVGSIKACHRALKLSEKSVIKAKVVYTQVNPPLKEFNKEYAADIKKSVRISKLLRHKTDVPRYFMKYKIETLKTAAGKKEKRLIANFSDGGDLKENLSQLTNRQRLKYISQLIIACAAMESQGVLHRDLKPQNIFFENKHIVIGDFGLSILKKHRVRDVVGTPGYIPPSSCKHQDRYALGMILLEIATGGNFSPLSLVPDVHRGVASEEKINELIDSLRLQSNHFIELIIALITNEMTLTQASERLVNVVEEDIKVDGFN